MSWPQDLPFKCNGYRYYSKAVGAALRRLPALLPPPGRVAIALGAVFPGALGWAVRWMQLTRSL